MTIDNNMLLKVLTRMISDITDVAILKDERAQNAALIYVNGLTDMAIVLGKVLDVPDDADWLKCLEDCISDVNELDDKVRSIARLMS